MERWRDEGPEARRATKSKTRLIMEQIHQSLAFHLCLSLVIHPQALPSFRWKSFQTAWREKWLRANAKRENGVQAVLAVMPCNLAEGGGRWKGRLKKEECRNDAGGKEEKARS